MNEDIIKIEINVKKAVYESAQKRFSDRQIEELLVQQLKYIADLDNPLPILRAFPEFVDFLDKKRAELAKLPNEVVGALLQVLDEVSPDKNAESIPKITSRVNEILQTKGGKLDKPYSGKRIGHLLSLLDFKGRRKGKGNLVIIDRDLLRQYRKGD